MMTPAQINSKIDRVKTNIINMVYDLNLTKSDLLYLEQFLTTAIETQAGLPYMEETLEAVQIHLRAWDLIGTPKPESPPIHTNQGEQPDAHNI